MTINSYQQLCARNQLNSISNHKKCVRSSAGSANKGDFTTGRKPFTDQSESKRSIMSPYLNGEKVQVISRVERVIRKKRNKFVSSFPLAVNIYKANSDEFKTPKKKSKKIKKSVLTLPTKPAPLPQTCTVSDMNESEYFSPTIGEKTSRPAKRKKFKTNRKCRNQSKGVDFFDRDAHYDLDCSSTDLFQNFTGIDDRHSRKQKDKAISKYNVKAHDVWSILRNMNRFQFQPSPPHSEDSVEPLKKTCNKRRGLSKDTRLIESCQTEEFAYISSYGIENSSYSQSSCDRVTVIDNQDKMSLSQDFFESITNNDSGPDALKPKIHNKKKIRKTEHLKDDTKVIDKKENIKDIKQYVITANNLNSTSYEIDKHRQRIKSNTKSNKNYQSNQKLNNSSKKISLVNQKQSIPLECTRDINNLQDRRKISEPEKNWKCIDDSVIGDHNSTDTDSGHQSISNKTSGNKKGDKIETSLRKPENESRKEVNGITRVLLNKEPTETLPQSRISKISTLVTALPTFRTPKLTQADIKRRIANIKFPLVILGKDQLSSLMCIPNFEPPQFSGLEKHIWPFMVNWVNDGHKNKSESFEDTINNNGNRKWFSIRNHSNNLNSDLKSKDVKVSTKPVCISKDSAKENLRTKTKSTRLKEKMLSFISGKNMSHNVYKKGLSGVQSDRKLKTHQSNMSTQTEISKNESETSKNQKNVTLKYQWGKGKWASDFIENVMKKIKSGDYYTQELKDKHKCEFKEDSTQTDLKSYEDSASAVIPKVFIEIKKDLPINIPGFDDAIPELEIETFNKDHIAVKHCVTNVVVKFDIIVPWNSRKGIIKHTRSISYLPVTENYTKIIKYNNTILNTVLPAELCTILPKVMRNMIDYSKRLELPESNNDIINSQLKPMSGAAHFKSFNNFSPSINFKPIIKFGNKGLSGKKQITSINVQEMCKNNMNRFLIHDFVSSFKINVDTKLIFNSTVSPVAYTTSYSKNNMLLKRQLTETINEVTDSMQTCKAVQLYLLSKKAVVPAYGRFTFTDLMEEFNYYIDAINKCLYVYRIKVILTLINVNLIGYETKKNSKETKMITYNVQIDSFFKAKHQQKSKDLNLIYNSTSNKTLLKRKTKSGFVSSRSRKINYVKLYRNCKSMSNLPQSNSVTLLDKITGIDDFFQVLGLPKSLSSVLDGRSEKKIISSLAEMKNWISSITPKQALLVMLLCNKKDTNNLVRYRPILLQGISVNRITRVSELDMEIEVIERENLNKLFQCEGISYLPASLENQDNLYEELYWIAKTTASDYQKPFDEQSERLLKKLLEKRKKLNPSYLRVMARYVGLGLLKSLK